MIQEETDEMKKIYLATKTLKNVIFYFWKETIQSL